MRVSSDVADKITKMLIEGSAKEGCRRAWLADPDRDNDIGTQSVGHQEIHIPGWVPTPLNKLLHSHWAVAGRLKKADRDMVAMHVRQQKIATVTIVRSDAPRKTGTGKPTVGAMLKGTGPKRRVSMRITLGKGERRCDKDAYWKSTLDALVACGALVQDTPKWSDMGTVEFARGKRGTTIILEDIS